MQEQTRSFQSIGHLAPDASNQYFRRIRHPVADSVALCCCWRRLASFAVNVEFAPATRKLDADDDIADATELQGNADSYIEKEPT
ncbi:hypothetical protein U1Q18_051397, partial [Sarracenia purpurea var. burkii]